MRAHAGYRVGGLASPVHSIVGDLMGRYVMYYFPSHVSLAARMKVAVLVVYLLSLAAAAFFPRIRRRPGAGLLLMTAALYYCELAVVDWEQMPHYMVHVIVSFALVLACIIDYFVSGTSDSSGVAQHGNGDVHTNPDWWPRTEDLQEQTLE